MQFKIAEAVSQQGLAGNEEKIIQTAAASLAERVATLELQKAELEEIVKNYGEPAAKNLTERHIECVPKTDKSDDGVRETTNEALASSLYTDLDGQQTVAVEEEVKKVCVKLEKFIDEAQQNRSSTEEKRLTTEVQLKSQEINDLERANDRLSSRLADLKAHHDELEEIIYEKDRVITSQNLELIEKTRLEETLREKDCVISSSELELKTQAERILKLEEDLAQATSSQNEICGDSPKSTENNGETLDMSDEDCEASVDHDTDPAAKDNSESNRGQEHVDPDDHQRLQQAESQKQARLEPDLNALYDKYTEACNAAKWATMQSRERDKTHKLLRASKKRLDLAWNVSLVDIKVLCRHSTGILVRKLLFQVCSGASHHVILEAIEQILHNGFQHRTSVMEVQVLYRAALGYISNSPRVAYSTDESPFDLLLRYLACARMLELILRAQDKLPGLTDFNLEESGLLPIAELFCSLEEKAGSLCVSSNFFACLMFWLRHSIPKIPGTIPYLWRGWDQIIHDKMLVCLGSEKTILGRGQDFVTWYRPDGNIFLYAPKDVDSKLSIAQGHLVARGSRRGVTNGVSNLNYKTDFFVERKTTPDYSFVQCMSDVSVKGIQYLESAEDVNNFHQQVQTHTRHFRIGGPAWENPKLKRTEIIDF